MNEYMACNQHADDLTLDLRDSLSLKNALGTIDEFCIHTGSKIKLRNLKDVYKDLYCIKIVEKRSLRSML